MNFEWVSLLHKSGKYLLETPKSTLEIIYQSCKEENKIKFSSESEVKGIMA